MRKIVAGAALLAAITMPQLSIAKIWRLNNNAGVTADFTNLNAAFTNASVVSGDTIHLEASTIDYGSATLNKRLVIIGLGYFLDPANTTFPANTGLQASTMVGALSSITIGTGSNGSKFIGVVFNSSISVSANPNPLNISFEKCFINSGIFFPSTAVSGITVRKCFFNNARIETNTANTLSDFVCENNIFFTTFSYLNLSGLTGSNNIFRNNSFRDVGATSTISNCYVANNIFGTSPVINFTNCTIKNNLFQANQTLPPTATNNQINVNMTNVYVGGTTGSIDSRLVLKAGSPAIAAGLTVGSVTTPDCGAFGATDPYKLSGIPNIPSIYALSVPISIPAGSNTMNVTFSTRSNN
ncbi:hypothetical protein [Phnomibacter sp. MR]|uniref:hypothetical protein n=1 Tax=Phnomibacter sp. MR TaxID=3042318 RepID=UPI003A7FE54D